MEDYNATGNYYTIGHIVLISGLTDRTVRNHLRAGFLKGEQINGVWHFTPEQADAYLRHPAVRPSIQAKHNALVYDFLLETRRDTRQACMILDLPGTDPESAAEYFCYTISQGPFEDIRFSFDSIGGTPRVILKGDTKEVLALSNGFLAQNST